MRNPKITNYFNRDGVFLGQSIEQLITTCVTLFIFCGHALAADDRLLLDRLEADQPEELLVIDERLFSSIKTTVDLTNIIRHENMSLAIRAAWERSRLKAEPQEATASRWRELRYRVAASEFLGFCEGRLRVSLPENFSNTLLNVDPQERFGCVFEPQKYLSTRDCRNGIIVDAALQIEFDGLGKSFSIHGDAEKIVIPASLLEHRGGDGVKSGLSLLILRDTVIVASYDMLGFKYKLKCVNKTTGKVKWENEVWGRGFGAVTGAGFHHVVKMVEDHGMIFVFGNSWDEIYIEAFDLGAGTAKMRFCNSY